MTCCAFPSRSLRSLSCDSSSPARDLGQAAREVHEVFRCNFTSHASELHCQFCYHVHHILHSLSFRLYRSASQKLVRTSPRPTPACIPTRHGCSRHPSSRTLPATRFECDPLQPLHSPKGHASHTSWGAATGTLQGVCAKQQTSRS